MIDAASLNEGSGILTGPTGNQTSRQKVRSALKEAKEARNAVAHNRIIDSGKFEHYNKELLELLDIMHFDVAKALDRSEKVRGLVITDQRKVVSAMASGHLPPLNGGLGRRKRRRRRGRING